MMCPAYELGSYLTGAISSESRLQIYQILFFSNRIFLHVLKKQFSSCKTKFKQYKGLFFVEQKFRGHVSPTVAALVLKIREIQKQFVLIRFERFSHTIKVARIPKTEKNARNQYLSKIETMPN